MHAVKATWKNGRILPGEPINWPEGSEVIIEPVEINGESVGVNESEWRDDEAALADWDAWLQTVEPVVLTPAEKIEFANFEERMRQHNLEAVRRQMKFEDAR